MQAQKRKILVSSVLMCGVLLGFYMKPLFAGTKEAAVSFETVMGEESMLDSVAFKGFHVEGGRTGNVVITTEDMEYLSRGSGLSSFLGGGTLKQAELRERFPSFVRGKGGYTNLFTEDEGYVYYVGDYYEPNRNDFQPIQLDMERLDKNTGETDRRKLEVADAEQAYMLQVLDLQTAGNIVAIHLLKASGSSPSEEGIYLYDWAQGTVLDQIGWDELGQPSEAGTTVSIALAGDTARLLIERITHLYNGETQSGYWIYDIASSQMKAFEAPDEMTEEGWRWVFTGDEVYFARGEENQVQLKIVPVESSEQVKESELALAPDLFGETEESIPPMLVDLDKEHLLLTQYHMTNETPAGIVLLEKSSGNIVYEGKLHLKGDGTPPKLDEEYLYFEEISHD